MFFALALAIPPAWAETVTDEITLSTTGVSGSSYTSFSGKTANSDAVYAGFIAGGNSAIQINFNSNGYGVWLTKSGGTVKSITVDFNTATAGARTLRIYGKNSAYTRGDITDASGRGTQIAAFLKSDGLSQTVTPTSDFEYLCFTTLKNDGGALYIDKITIVWETEGGSSLTPINTFSFSESSCTATLGQTFNAPTLTVDPEEAASDVVYSSSNTGVATVNASTGVVTLVGAGETTITAAINGSDTYYNATASYTLTVEEAPEEGVIIDFKETFNDCDGTGGNDGGWSGSIASAKFDTDLADNSGWTIGENVYKAYKCIKLGKSGGTSYATTPSISVIPGIEYTLTFKAGAWNGAKTDLYITATGGSLSQSSVTMQNNAWTTYTITFTPTSDNATFKFQGVVNDGDARFFLDEVVLKHEEAIVVATPTFSLADGTYAGAQTVNISCETEDAIIYYKIGDGNWIEGSSLTVNQSSTVYAKAVLDGVESEIASATYTITYNPYITVTKTELSINDVVGEENKFDVSARNIRDWQNLSVTPNNGFSVSGTSTPSTWYNDNGNTGFYSNSEHSADGTVTVTYEGRELIATGNVNCGTDGAEPKNVAVSYRSDLYIVNNNGQGDDGWNFGEGIAMTYDETDNVYTGTITTTNPDTKIVFARLLGNGVGWNTRLVFGADSNGDWRYGDFTAGNLNVNDDVAIWFPEAGEYTITINASNKTFSIVKTVPINYCPAVIEFKDNGTDESSDIADLAAFRAYLNAGSQFIQDASWGKVYKGIIGIKFSSKSVNGNLLIDLKPLTNGGSWKTSKVIVNAKQYSDDEAYISVNNQEAQRLTNEFADYEFTLDGSVISSIEIDATKRIYVKSITIMHECGDEPVLEQVAIPTFSPAAGSYNEVTDVTINCATGGATIYYTTDGTEPTSSSAVYSEPIHLTTTTTIKAIAMKDGMENSTVATAEYTLPQSVSTIAEALTLKDNFIFTGNAVVTFHNSNHLYVRDETGSGLLYQVSAEEHKYNNGDVLTPNWSAGYLLYQDYTPQFSSPKNVGSTENNGGVAPEILTGLAVDDVNKFAGFNNVTINRSEEQNGKMNYYCSVGESKQEVCLRAAYTDLVASLIEGKTYNVTGVVTVFDGTPQLNLISATIVKQDPGLAFSKENVNATYGADFTEPELTKPEGVTVKYSSENTEVAEINETTGEVTIKKIGNAKITATSVENEYYTVGTASYNIVVSAGTPTFAYSADAKEVVFGAENPELPTLNNPNSLTVTYTSSKPEVATVNENGVVTIVGAGTTVITATGAATGNYGAATASYELTVSKADLEVSFNNETPDPITIGDNFTAPVLSEVPEGTTVSYKSDNENVAKVDATTGEVEIVGVGSAVITATVTGDNYNETSASYTITVNDVEVAIAAPTFAPAAGTYTEPKEVAIACATPGVTIEYSFDGNNWTEGNIVNVTESCTLYAKASKGSKVVYNDSEASATYVINAAPAAGIEDGYYSLQNNAEEVAGKYANVAGRRTLNFVADADNQAGTVFRIKTDPDTIGQVETLRSQAVDLQGYANRAMAYVPKVIEVVLNKLANSSLGDPETPGDGILGENGLDLILEKFYKNFDYHLYIEQAEGGYRIYGKTPSMQHVVDFYHENTAQVEAKLPMLEGYINQVLDKIRNRIPAPYNANVVLPFSLKAVRDSIAKKNGITLIDPTEDEMGFYRQVLNNKEYVWDFAYQTAMMYVDAIKGTQTYAGLPAEYKLYVEKMEKVRPDTKYYIIERGNELDYISENNVEIINNDPRTLWTITERETFKLSSAGELFGCPLATTGVGGYFTTNYTDFAYTLPEGVTAYKVTGVNEDGEAQLEALEGTIPAQTPVLLVAKEDGAYEVTLTTDAGTAVGTNELKGPDYLITEYQIQTPIVVQLFSFAQGILGDNLYNTYVAPYEYLQLRYSGTVNNKYFWNVNSDLDELNGDCVVRSLAVKDGELAFSDHWTTENNKAFMVSEDYNAITLPSTKRGDVNHDGNVNIFDVTDLIDRILGNIDLTTGDFAACPYCSDVNENHGVNIDDVTELIDILLANGVSTIVPDEGEGE